MNRRLVFPFIFVSLILSACTKKGGGLEYGLNPKDTIRINLMQEPPTLDWNKATDTTSGLVILNIMDTLVDYNLTDPELATVPGLATEWKSSKDARTWTITLRKGVKWTDGVDFTAQQVLDGWERLLNPATASEYAYFLFPLRNGKAYNSGKIKDFSQVGVKVDDKGQIVVELEKPMSFFPMLLTHESTLPVRKDLIQKFGEKWTDPANIQTLGPYKLKAWDHDKAIVLERNDGYWGEKAKTKDIIGYMINEFSTATNLFEAGKLDFQETVPLDELARFRAMPTYVGAPSTSIYYYGFNTRKPPFDNVKVRQAFSMAINRKEVTDLLGAGQKPLTSWIPVGMFGYEENIGLKFDAAKAAKLLDEAGYKDRSKFPKVTLEYNTNENHQRIAENVQGQLKKNLGIEIELANEEWKVFLNHLHNDTPPLFRMGWLADYPDPDNFMNLMTSYSENNYSGWGNKKYDELIERGAAEMKKDKRREIYSEAQKLLTETDVPVIPIYSDVRPLLISERMKGFPVNALNRWEFKGVTLK